MTTTTEEKLGTTTIRVQQNNDGTFSGTTIAKGRRGEVLHDDDRDRLLARLRNQAGTLEPNYYGMEGAISRFLEFMPGGFEGERNLEQEREYKMKAHRALSAVVPLADAATAEHDEARRVRAASVWINLLSPYESMHLKEAMEGQMGGAFLRAAAKFAAGDIGAGAQGMRLAMKAHGPLTWPIATYFPFLWDPEHHMFLKPTVTQDYAQRIGHRFQYDYESEIRPDVYESLLDLTNQTKTAIAHLKPRDNIDVQSFIYVIGGYGDADRPE